jgi:hypothetical protein
MSGHMDGGSQRGAPSRLPAAGPPAGPGGPRIPRIGLRRAPRQPGRSVTAWVRGAFPVAGPVPDQRESGTSFAGGGVQARALIPATWTRVKVLGRPRQGTPAPNQPDHHPLPGRFRLRRRPSCPTARPSGCAGCATPATPTTGASPPTAPATRTTRTPGYPPGTWPAPPSKPSTPPAASTWPTPPPGPEPRRTNENAH